VVVTWAAACEDRLANEDAVLCYAARKLGRPVKWRAERSEEFLAAHMGRDQHDEAELALDKDGRILGLRARVTANFGATPVGSTAIIPLFIGPKVPTAYTPAVDYHARGALTNTTATGPIGSRSPEANYLMERPKRAAREMRIRRNAPPQPDPTSALLYRTTWVMSTIQGFSSGKRTAYVGLEKFRARKKPKQRQIASRGLAVYLKRTGAPTETVDIEVEADGTVTVFDRAMGQGWKPAIRSSSLKF
jgi:carbon-monoxide dehydrogenase large subunit